MSRKKRKKPPGTWVERDLFMSRAFLSLGGVAPQLLILFLGKRKADEKGNWTNLDNITMTYPELENIFNQGRKNKNIPRDGITRPRIIRGFDELLAKGFIKIARRGGAFKQDKTIFSLTNDWLFWQPGMVIFEREKDTRTRGYRKPNSKKVTHENITHTLA